MDSYVFAKALVWLRLKQEATPPEPIEPYRAAVEAACLAARETENDGDTLALGRNLLGYVLAASIIDWSSQAQKNLFNTWLSAVRHEVMIDTRTLIETHETRPNNWGTHAGASRLAAAVYLYDTIDEDRCWEVFRRWLGDTTSPFDFACTDYGELRWQADELAPIGINPTNTWRLDNLNVLRPIGGVLADDQRRGGGDLNDLVVECLSTTSMCNPPPTHGCCCPFSWPPIKTNYTYDALQGVLAQAVMHDRRGRDPWSIGDDAIRRSFTWLADEALQPIGSTGWEDGNDNDDKWQTFIVNNIYGTGFAEISPTRPGKAVGFADWTAANANWP